ncbi:MAG: F0F1 ATP synthase subunit A [Armatimonadota bacterium]|nr:F0F1 ATP synthase subunit A [Armatimonadota bacterium]
MNGKEIPTFFDKFSANANSPLGHLLGIDAKAHPDLHLNFVVVTWIVCAIMIITAAIVGKNLQRVPGKFQNILENVYLIADDFVTGITGPEGTGYTPFILTLFLFIFLGSFIGIVPGFAATTSNINTTAALALFAFAYVNYHAIRTVGLASFIKGFFPPPLWMAWLIGPLEIISHIIRPLTLAVRLFGNIFGEDVVIATLTVFGVAIVVAGHQLALPLQVPMVAFSVFTDMVQGAVFCMLTTIYIGLLTSHGHDGHGHAEEEPPHAHEAYGQSEPMTSPV